MRTILLAVVLLAPLIVDAMIITSVYGGRKKFKTIAFDMLPFLPPIAFEQPNKLQFAYRGHYTIKPPNLNFKLNIPVPLPITPFNGMHFSFEKPQDNYETAGTSSDQFDHPDTSEEVYAPQFDTANNLDSAPAYIRNGGHQQVVPSNDGYETKSDAPPRPYTGKAQVSSFIDNGQFVTASRDGDAMFSDQPDVPEVPGDIRRTKTIQLGYEKVKPPTPSYLTAHAAHPDSLPWGLGYEDLQKYYTTFQFTDHLRGQVVPMKRKGLFGFNKFFPTLG